jgi:DNA-binding MarR family transcriptional regulator
MRDLAEAEMGSVDRVWTIMRAFRSSMSLELIRTFLAIARRQGLSVQELADELGVPQSSVSRYVKALAGYESREGKLGPLKWEVGSDGYGLIEQRINEQEPRKRSLVLSEEGLALVQKLQAAVEGAPIDGIEGKARTLRNVFRLSAGPPLDAESE